MKTLLPCALVALSSLACSSASFADGAPASATAKPGEFRFERTLGAATRVEVRDQNGPIRVEPASGDALEIVAIKTGRPQDVARVQVIAREEGGAIVVCTVWPGQDTSGCHPGSGASGRADDDVQVRVDFRVRVPARVSALEARTLNGAIDAQSPAGEVSLHSLNGAIHVSARGPIDAETLNGAVVASALPGNAVHLATKNGKVELSLPPATNADVQASTMNGHVISELGDVPSPGIPRLHDVTLRLGSGGTPISLRTLNGDVTVRRAGG